MGRLTENLDAITNKIRQSFEAKDAAREKVLPICREVIRFSSLSIRLARTSPADVSPAKRTPGPAPPRTG